MESPFPGMDPYIEACGLWEDFHNSFIAQIALQLATKTPDHYVVRTGDREYIDLVEAEGKKEHLFKPDVSVTTPRGRKKGAKRGSVALAEPDTQPKPHVLRAFIADEYRETFIEIYETDPEMRLVTTIEVLSPSNKQPGSTGWDLYQRKRQSILLGSTSLVEIDLLRGGTRMPMVDPWPDSPYTLLVSRPRKPFTCNVWEAHYRQPLPPIPIPLAEPDPPVMIDLQPLIGTIYRLFRYGQSIKYEAPLTPGLSPEDEAWCRQLLQARPRGS